MAIFAQAVPAYAQEQTYSFDIPSQDLGSALKAFARASNQQITFDTSVVRGKRSPALRGTYSARAALDLLLQGSRLQAEAGRSGVFIVRPLSTAIPQRESGTSSSSLVEGPLAAPTTAAENAAGQEIVVTGTNIHGRQAAGTKLITIGRKDIEHSGYGRVQDILGTLTQNFNAANEQNGVLSGGATNFNRGAEVQLRGLGTGTTLTLVNGQRQALGGEDGILTDVSSIPLAAIERIEVLPDGASALYGSDAIGGVVNIILRKDLNGFETQLRVGTANGDATERTISQLWGHTWASGHLLVGYQYNDRDALKCSDRAYCAANGNLTRFGGSDSRTVGGNPGTVLDIDTFLPVGAIPRGQDGTDLTPDQLILGSVNYTDNVTPTTLLPKQWMHSAFVSTSYDFAKEWSASFDGRFVRRKFRSTSAQFSCCFVVPAENAFNRFGAPVALEYDFTPDIGPLLDTGTTTTYSLSGGITGKLPKNWLVNIRGAYSHERNYFLESNTLNFGAVDTALADPDPSTALNIFGDGANISEANRAAISSGADFTYDVKSRLTSVSAVADGPLIQLPAGAARLAIGLDYRNEDLVKTRPLSRNIYAAFAELAIPVFENSDASSQAGKMDVSLAGRYEHYSDFGTTFNPKVGFTWSPTSFAKLRGTWGTSFRAPPLSFAYSRKVYIVRRVPDPESPTGSSNVLALFGPIETLKPETANVWTAGVDLTPSRNLDASVTYYSINYKGKIQAPGGFTQFLTQPSIFADLITRDPTPEELAVFCTSPNLLGTCSGPIAAIVDNRVRNLSRRTTEGMDADLSYSVQSSVGDWRFAVHGTYVFNLKQQLTSTAPKFNVINTVGNPLKFRASGNISWNLGSWSAQTTVNYVNLYHDPNFAPARKVDSWTTVDLNLEYKFGPEINALHDTRLDLGIINLFNQRPPFVDQFGGIAGTAIGYDNANASLIGRQLSLQLIKPW